jgi:hypothetical protein
MATAYKFETTAEKSTNSAIWYADVSGQGYRKEYTCQVASSPLGWQAD